MKRVLFNNICYKYKENQYIMNLISYRRKKISEIEYQLLHKIDRKIASDTKLNTSEDVFYKKLINEKQILSDNQIAIFDKELFSACNKLGDKIKSITINYSYACNFQCAYCYQKRYSDTKGVMSIHKIDQIYEFLRIYFENCNSEFRLENIIISGGEPLLEAQIETINYTIQKFKNKVKNIILFTNGVNIYKFRNRINFNAFSEVQISLDGDNNVIKEINNSKVQIDITEILNGIKYLAKKDIKIRVVTMMVDAHSPDNLSKLITILDSFELFNFKNISFRSTYIINHKSDSLTDKDYYNLEDYINLRKATKAIVKGTKYTVDSFYSLSNLASVILRKNGQIPHQISKCGVPDHVSLNFGPSGKTYYCMCVDPSLGIIGEFYPKIRIYEKKLLEFQNRNIFNIYDCKKCEFRHVCLSGCPLELIGSNIPINSPNCGAYKNAFCMDKLEDFIF
ncbi:MAG: radical SAM protein [Tenericutes bacterium]|nr:radical SAM protein [Mycoplasmatota bacterium]